MSITILSPNFYEGRRSAIKWIVWHSTESGEVRGGAYNVAANWFRLTKSQASAHIVTDDGADPRYPDGVVRCVDPADTAWHAKAANAAGYGIEIVGRAGQSGVDWTDPYSLAAIRNACTHIKTVPELDHIPARWLTDEQLRRGESGHITHAQVTRVLGGTHTDPGQHFPAGYVMACLAGRKEDDMTPDEMKYEVLAGGWRFDGRNPIDMLRQTTASALDAQNLLRALHAKVDTLAGELSDDEANIVAAIRAGGTGITPEQHAEILRQQLPVAVLAALVELAKAAA